MIRKGTPLRTLAIALAAIGGVGAFGVGALLGQAVNPPAAEAATVAECTNGVIVAVDFAPFRRKTNTVCDAPLPKNAAEALVNAKFDPTGVTEYPGLSFICTIGGDPPGADCSTTPTGAYWEFWYAKAGSNSWTYSPLGAESLVPATGSVEGWFFGTGTGASPPKGAPSPNAIRSTIHATPTTTTSPPSTTATTTHPSTPTGATTPLAPNIGSPTTTAPPTKPAPTTTTRAKAPNRKRKATPKRSTPSTSARSKTTLDSRADHKATAKPVDPKEHPSGIVEGAPAVVRSRPGSPVPVVVGAVITLALAAAAWVIARRRRRTEEG